MKITRATLKSFIKKNQGKLLINNKTNFDGMVDCVMPCDDKGFRPIKSDDRPDNQYTLGICGCWLVGSSGDLFTVYDDGVHQGIEIYNCCGSFILAIKK
jgi:hypothetical protein